MECGDVIDRLAAIVRYENRKNAGTLFDFDGELTNQEQHCLGAIGNGFIDRITPNEKRKIPIYDALAAKGCIVMGQPASAIVWAGESRPELKVDPNWYAVKITERGKERLRMIQAAKKETA